MARSVAIALVVAGVLAGALESATAAPSSPKSVPPVSLVPVGSFPESDAEALARYFASRFGLRTRVLTRERLPIAAYDRARRQYVAEKLFGVLHKPVGDPQVVIGLTLEDMYTSAKPYWRYTFWIRSARGFALVSRARMDPRLVGLTPDPALRMRRLQKMVLKNIGLLGYGRAPSGNPRSALYDSILSVDDLDFMTQEFQPKTPSSARRSWLGRANGVCGRGIREAKTLINRSQVTTRPGFFAFARASIELEAKHRMQLGEIPPAAEDRAGVRALLSRFAGEEKADRVAVARLSAHWSESAARRWLQADIRTNVALKSNALELGSRSCGRYFDPATYSG